MPRSSNDERDRPRDSPMQPRAEHIMIDSRIFPHDNCRPILFLSSRPPTAPPPTHYVLCHPGSLRSLIVCLFLYLLWVTRLPAASALHHELKGRRLVAGYAEPSQGPDTFFLSCDCLLPVLICCSCIQLL
ncbi:uncharacterized protein BDV14DRAFT_78733 [Aspergillus stella-maris]|uniref:uncharacterized protein n=1 Tax=Aspergillus stella-maris TaxID=1810926 RepID=UPI003CCD57FC